MNISELYGTGRFAISFEIFPPKTDDGMESLYQCIGELAALHPGFISCTYGAGGSTRDKTFDIVTSIKNHWKISATAHFTCVGSTKEQIREWLSLAHSLGVENIMALRGDPPKGESEFKVTAGGLSYANQLVELIRAEFPTFGIGVAGYPETHQEAKSEQHDLEALKRKVDAGADAVFTQLFYDNDDYFRFVDRAQKTGVSVPIIPGLLPVLSFAQVQRITALCKAKLPAKLVGQLEERGSDSKAQMNIGVDHCIEQCRGLLKAGVPGIHFYVLNKSQAVQRILAAIKEDLPQTGVPGK